MNERTYLLFAYIFNYFFPMILITVFYYSIVKAVVAHEAALKAQAKKMNVDSLRSAGKDDAESAEVKIAKVAITNVMLWVCIWTPYAAVCALPALGYASALTPLVSQLPSFLGKIVLSHLINLLSLQQPRLPAVSTPSSTLFLIQSSEKLWPRSCLALVLERSHDTLILGLWFKRPQKTARLII